MNDFGGKLRQAREGRGISLRQIAATTKISVSALEALERNDISKLPGGIFSRAFVRSYAAEVGLDPEQTVRDFLERFQYEPVAGPPVHAPIPEAEEDFESRRRAALLVVKVVIALLVIAAVATYFVFKGRSAADGADAGPVAQAATPSSVESGLAPAASTGSGQVSAAPGPMQLELRPTGPCWVRLVVDGQTILERLMEAGERQSVSVREAAVVDVGDAGAFAFAVDGREGRPLGTSGQVANMRLTRETLPKYLR
jgi:cytoskeletal protein RodZ